MRGFGLGLAGGAADGRGLRQQPFPGNFVPTVHAQAVKPVGHALAPLSRSASVSRSSTISRCSSPSSRLARFSRSDGVRCFMVLGFGSWQSGLQGLAPCRPSRPWPRRCPKCRRSPERRARSVPDHDGQCLDTLDPLHGALDGMLLRMAGGMPAQRDDAVLDDHADVGGVHGDRWIEVQFGDDIASGRFTVGSAGPAGLR